MAITKKTETKAAVKETAKPAEAEVKKAAAAVKEAAPVKAAAAVKEAAPVKETAPVKEAAPAKAAAPKKAAAKKETAPKKAAAAKKPAAPKKAAPAKKTVKANVYVQYQEKEVSADKLIAEAKKAYVAAGNKETDIKTIDVYVKPEENAAYYVVNGIGSDEYKIYL